VSFPPAHAPREIETLCAAKSRQAYRGEVASARRETRLKQSRRIIIALTAPAAAFSARPRASLAGIQSIFFKKSF
jgi:hypothetical protein